MALNPVIIQLVLAPVSAFSHQTRIANSCCKFVHHGRRQSHVSCGRFDNYCKAECFFCLRDPSASERFCLQQEETRAKRTVSEWASSCRLQAAYSASDPHSRYQRRDTGARLTSTQDTQDRVLPQMLCTTQPTLSVVQSSYAALCEKAATAEGLLPTPTEGYISIQEHSWLVMDE